MGGEPDPMLGQVLDGRYRLTQKLGEGGMGEVYAAEHIHIQKKVAIKLLRAEIVTNQEAVSRFKQEAFSASSIKHKNIIGIEDFGTLDDGRIYLAMELLDGQPFNEMIEKPLPPARLLNILIQTGHGLATAHAKGIVHRDMKPENIFVTAGDVPKLLDFGIAKVSGADGNNNLTRTGTIFGTPFYMSPEQALGQQVDHRADIYAMGVIMYEVFCGSIPFQGESFMGILTQHITADPKPPAQMAAENGKQLMPGIEPVIVRAMKKEPDERYQTMDELVQALVTLYRGVAGSGMSSYMEAYQPAGPQSATIAAVDPSSPAMPVAHPPSPTPMPFGPGQQAPTPTPYGPGPGGPPTGPGRASGPQPMQPPMGPGPGAPAMRPGPYNSPSASYQPQKSRAGLWVFLIIVLLGGGGAAVYFAAFYNKDSGGGSDVDAGQVAAADAGSVTPLDASSGDGDSDSAAAALAEFAKFKDDMCACKDKACADGVNQRFMEWGQKHAGDTAPTDQALIEKATKLGEEYGKCMTAATAGTTIDVTPDAGVERPTEVAVKVTSDPPGAVVKRGRKRLGKTPLVVKLKPGESARLRLAHGGYKPKTVTINTRRKEFSVTLTKRGGTGVGTGSGSGSGTGSADRPCRENDPRPKCQLE